MNKKYITRKHYIKKIEPFIGKDIIKVFVGQRRVGKSYMLYQIMDHIKDSHPSANCIYINKELDEFSRIKTHEELLRYIKDKSTAGDNRLFIDEIQEISDFERALRSLTAEGGYDIYCTGSNADILSGELATYLAGRAVEFRIFGLTYEEFLLFHDIEDSDESLAKFFRYGGLPYLRNLELADETVFEYLRNIYSAILYRDVVARYGIRNTVFLENLVSYLADNTGSLVSAKKISDFLKSQRVKISPNIVLDYLSHLASAFFISRVRRTDLRGKKIFEIGEKFYFEDLGLRHSIIGFRHGDIGKIIENLVFHHLRTAGYVVTVGKLGEKEIDFVGEKGGEKIYIQAAYLIADDSARDREFGNLLAVDDNFRKIVVSMDAVTGGTYRGIEHITLRDFLRMRI